MTFVDRPVKGLRVDQVPQQRGGGAGQAAAGQQGPRRLLPPGEKKRQLAAQTAFNSPHNVYLKYCLWNYVML